MLGQQLETRALLVRDSNFSKKCGHSVRRSTKKGKQIRIRPTLKIFRQNTKLDSFLTKNLVANHSKRGYWVTAKQKRVRWMRAS